MALEVEDDQVRVHRTWTRCQSNNDNVVWRKKQDSLIRIRFETTTAFVPAPE